VFLGYVGGLKSTFNDLLKSVVAQYNVSIIEKGRAKSFCGHLQQN